MKDVASRFAILRAAGGVLLSLNACAGVPAAGIEPVPSPTDTVTVLLTPAPSAAPSSTPAPPIDEAAFKSDLYQQIADRDVVPQFATLTIAPLYIEQPTFAFRPNEGIILQLNIFGYPDPKGTKQLVAPLIELGADVAARHEVSLNGIEVVFHRRSNYNPMQVWANIPPWDIEEMILTPLTRELIEEMGN